jgi:hypothetical protein
MPQKSKPRKSQISKNEIWIAPRSPNTSSPRTFEPAGSTRSNRYLEFADIALGVKKLESRVKRAARAAEHDRHAKKSDLKVTSIDSARNHPARGFGAFRSSR